MNAWEFCQSRAPSGDLEQHVTMNTVCSRCKLFRSRSMSSQTERTLFVICLPSAGHDAQHVANESICDVTMIDVLITHSHFFDSLKSNMKEATSCQAKRLISYFVSN